MWFLRREHWNTVQTFFVVSTFSFTKSSSLLTGASTLGFNFYKTEITHLIHSHTLESTPQENELVCCKPIFVCDTGVEWSQVLSIWIQTQQLVKFQFQICADLLKSKISNIHMCRRFSTSLFQFIIPTLILQFDWTVFIWDLSACLNTWDPHCWGPNLLDLWMHSNLLDLCLDAFIVWSECFNRLSLNIDT